MDIADIVVMGLLGVGALIALVSFIFFIMVVVKMFKHGQTGLGIACLATSLLCGGIGVGIAFIYGWVKAGEWQMKGLMMGWTATALLASVFFCAGTGATAVLGQKASGTFSSVGMTIGGGGPPMKR